MSHYLSEDTKTELRSTVARLARAGCGILAADETPMAMEDRFKDLDVQNCPEVSGFYFQCQLILASKIFFA